MMKELSNFELITINGGEEVSSARKLGQTVGDFLGYCTAQVLHVCDIAVDVIKTVL